MAAEAPRVLSSVLCTDVISIVVPARFSRISDECAMNACSAALGPCECLLEPVIAPEQLLADQERWRAEDAARLRLCRLPSETLLDVGLLDARENPLGIKV